MKFLKSNIYTIWYVLFINYELCKKKNSEFVVNLPLWCRSLEFKYFTGESGTCHSVVYNSIHLTIWCFYCFFYFSGIHVVYTRTTVFLYIIKELISLQKYYTLHVTVFELSFVSAVTMEDTLVFIVLKVGCRFSTYFCAHQGNQNSPFWEPFSSSQHIPFLSWFNTSPEPSFKTESLSSTMFIFSVVTFTFLKLDKSTIKHPYPATASTSRFHTHLG